MLVLQMEAYLGHSKGKQNQTGSEISRHCTTTEVFFLMASFFGLWIFTHVLPRVWLCMDYNVASQSRPSHIRRILR